MFRRTLTTVTAALMAAVVGAQGSKDPTPAQRAKLFERNREVIEQVVKQTVESAKTPNDHVKRANTYYKVLYQFNTEIAKANDAHDTARVEELTRHLQTVLDKGLGPTLIRARDQVAQGTGVEEYRKAKDDLMAQVDALLGILAENPTAKASLEGAKQRLNDVSPPKK
jgi:hypothetical protein